MLDRSGAVIGMVIYSTKIMNKRMFIAYIRISHYKPWIEIAKKNIDERNMQYLPYKIFPSDFQLNISA